MNRLSQTFTAATLPDWWRKPGETWLEWDRRMCAEKDAEYARKVNETLAPPSADGRLSVDLAAGVGTYDGNGNPRGGGWS